MTDILLGAVEDWLPLFARRWNDYTHIDQGILPVVNPPGPALPTANHDWPVPRGYRFSNNLRTWINLGLPYPATMPRAPVFYRRPYLPGVRWDPPPNIIIMAFVQPPFVQREWPVPTRAKSNQVLGINAAPQITSNPFRQRDWPVPTRSKPNQTLGIYAEPQITPNPFRQVDWPLPLHIKYRQSITFSFGGQISASPFYQTQWPNPHGAKTNQPLNWSSTAQILPNPFLFDKWSNPKGPLYPVSLRTWISATAAILSPLQPFSESDWPNPRGAFYPTTLRTWISTVAAILSPLQPFSQNDWPNPRGGSSSQPLSLYGRYQITANPFHETYWPNPKGKPFPISLRTLLDARALQITPKPVPPHRLDYWPNPVGFRFPLELRTLYNRPFPPPIPPPIPPVPRQTTNVVVVNTGRHRTQGTARIGQAFSLIVTLNARIPLGNIPLSMTFVRPDGSTYYISDGPYLYVGNADLLATYADLLPRTYVVYNSLPNEFNQAGTWSVYVRAGVLFGDVGYFSVVNT